MRAAGDKPLSRVCKSCACEGFNIHWPTVCSLWLSQGAQADQCPFDTSVAFQVWLYRCRSLRALLALLLFLSVCGESLSPFYKPEAAMEAVTQRYEFDVPGPLNGSQEEPTQSNINIKSLF